MVAWEPLVAQEQCLPAWSPSPSTAVPLSTITAAKGQSFRVGGSPQKQYIRKVIEGRKGEGVKKYQLAITEQSWGCKVQRREYSH